MRLKPVAPLLAGQAVADTGVGDVEDRRRHVRRRRHAPRPARRQPFRRAERFDPDRWLGAGTASADARSPTASSMPFGAGPRLCPGRYLALVEMKIRSRCCSRTSRSIGRHRDGGPARELFAFAMGPVGLRMKLRR